MRLGRMAIRPQQREPRTKRVLRLTLYGEPVAKARPRVIRARADKPLTYTPARTAQAEEQWKALFLKSGERPFPAGTPLTLTLRAYLRRPEYLRKKERLPVTKPDGDNLLKLVCDALEGLAYHRDSQMVVMHVEKHYATYPDPPRVEIEIAELEAPD